MIQKQSYIDFFPERFEEPEELLIIPVKQPVGGPNHETRRSTSPVRESKCQAIPTDAQPLNAPIMTAKGTFIDRTGKEADLAQLYSKLALLGSRKHTLLYQMKHLRRHCHQILSQKSDNC